MSRLGPVRPDPSTVVLEGGTTLGEINAWLASLKDADNQPKARMVAPPRGLPIPGQTFAPEGDRPARFTKAEQQRLFEPPTRRDVRELMRNRHGVCG